MIITPQPVSGDHGGPPPIPATCAARPTIGGRVAPWVNVQLADGGVDYRRQHRTRVITALKRGLCQVDGIPLRHPIVLLGGPESVRHLLFAEPPLHPECAVYTSRACPLVAGALAQTATGLSVSQGKRGQTCFEPGCTCGGWVPSTPDDAKDEPVEAHPWYAVYASRFSIATRPDGDVFGALVELDDVLAVRLVSRPGEGRCWTTITDALTDYERPDTSTVRGQL